MPSTNQSFLNGQVLEQKPGSFRTAPLQLDVKLCTSRASRNLPVDPVLLATFMPAVLHRREQRDIAHGNARPVDHMAGTPHGRHPACEGGRPLKIRYFKIHWKIELSAIFSADKFGGGPPNKQSKKIAESSPGYGSELTAYNALLWELISKL